MVEVLDAKVVTGEEIQEFPIMPIPQAPVQQMKSSFQTALAVIRPRNMAQVERLITEEAKFGKETFFYSFPMGGKVIEGPSIELAKAFVRAYGNCAVETQVSDVVSHDGAYWEFTSYFIDLERGTTYSRTYRRKAGVGRMGKLASKDPQRVHDINFGAAQSISQRNAILSAAPKWITKVAMETAKTSIREDIRIETPARSIEKAINAFKGMGVDIPRIEKALGKSKSEWAEDEIIAMRGMYNAINDGQTSVESLFPAAEEKKVVETKDEVKTFEDTVKNITKLDTDPVAENIPGFFDNPLASEEKNGKSKKK